DPVATVASAISLLLALYARRRDGAGQLVESPMTGGALAIGAEMVLEHSAHGHLLGRDGNRSPHAAPQNVYAAADQDTVWVAIAVETDEQWRRLVAGLGSPDWARDPALEHLEGRRSRHDEIDGHLATFCATTKAAEILAMLSEAGVPASEVVTNNNYLVPELRARGFVEEIDHPVVGRYEQIGWPARFSSRPGPWLVSRAPLLGEHNASILAGLGVTEEERERLEAAGIIGSRPLY
ncbi:MAG: CoA transferase, partial [Acidimicrobiia bacterium]